MEQKTNDEEYYTCFCGLHVHEGSLVIAIITLIQAFFFAPMGYFSFFSYLVIATAIYSIASIISSILLIVGNRKHRPKLYVPVLIIKSLLILVSVLFNLTAFVCGVLIIFKILHVPDNNSDLAGLLNLVYSVVYITLIVFDVYFVTVISRDYVWLKEVQRKEIPTQRT